MPDRTTAEEWLAADRAAREADDAYRTITEEDVESDGLYVPEEPDYRAQGCR